MQYKCDFCQDTGSLHHDSNQLDCAKCDAATDRVALEAFIESLPAMGEQEQAWRIHQRALAMGMSANVEDTLNEMQPGGALHMPQEPVAHLKYWAAQRWSGCGDHEIEHGEGLEVCEPGEIGSDGLPAFPVFMHAIPGALAMAPKPEAVKEYLSTQGETPTIKENLIVPFGEAISALNHVRTVAPMSYGRDPRDVLCAFINLVAAPAVANGALTDADILTIIWKYSSFISVGNYSSTQFDCQADMLNCIRAILAAAGPDAALVQALERIARWHGEFPDVPNGDGIAPTPSLTDPTASVITCAKLRLPPSLALRGIDMGEWIKCSDRLPEDGDCVIAAIYPYNNRENSKIAVEAHHHDGTFLDYEGCTLHEPTHWMPIQPIPEAP